VLPSGSGLGVQLEQATKEEREELWRLCYAQDPMFVARECFFPFGDNIDFEAIYRNEEEGQVWREHIVGWIVAGCEIMWDTRVGAGNLKSMTWKLRWSNIKYLPFTKQIPYTKGGSYGHVPVKAEGGLERKGTRDPTA